MDVAATLRDQILRRERSSGEFDVYRAALEWDLVDPIVIENRDDLKSENRWKDRIAPYHHQVTNLMTFCRRLPVTLLADDVGLGKTISAGPTISELAARARAGADETRGRYKGRPKSAPLLASEARQMVADGRTVTEAARGARVARASVYRALEAV